MGNCISPDSKPTPPSTSYIDPSQSNVIQVASAGSMEPNKSKEGKEEELTISPRARANSKSSLKSAVTPVNESGEKKQVKIAEVKMTLPKIAEIAIAPAPTGHRNSDTPLYSSRVSFKEAPDKYESSESRIEELHPRVLDPKNLEIILRASYVHRGGKSCLKNHLAFLAEGQEPADFCRLHFAAIAQCVNLSLRRLAHFASDCIEARDPFVIRAIKLSKDKELNLFELQGLLKSLQESRALTCELRDENSLLQDQPEFVRYFWSRAPSLISKEQVTEEEAIEEIKKLSKAEEAIDEERSASKFTRVANNIKDQISITLIDKRAVIPDDVFAVKMRTVGNKNSFIEWKESNVKFTEMGLARYSRVREPDLMTETTTHMLFCSSVDISSFLYPLLDTPPPVPDEIAALEMPKLSDKPRSAAVSSPGSPITDKFSSNRLLSSESQSIIGITDKAIEIVRTFHRIIQSASYREIPCSLVFTHCDLFCSMIRSTEPTSQGQLIARRNHLNIIKQTFKSASSAIDQEDDSCNIWHFCGYDGRSQDPYDAIRFIASIFACAHDYGTKPSNAHQFPLGIYAANLLSDVSLKLLMSNLTDSIVKEPKELLENPRCIPFWNNILTFPHVSESVGDKGGKLGSLPLKQRAYFLPLVPIESTLAEILDKRDLYQFSLFSTRFKEKILLLLRSIMRKPNGVAYFPKSNLSKLDRKEIILIMSYLK